MKKVIYFETTNTDKLLEVQRQFSRYGVEVISKADRGYFAWMKEHTELVRMDGGKVKQLQLEGVCHESVLIYQIMSGKNKGKVGSFKNVVCGYLDFTRKIEDTFGFDSYFLVKGLNLTYYELGQLGFKLSARDHCVSQFIEMFLYRTKLGDWKFNPQNYRKPLELHRDPYLFFKDNKYVNNPFALKYGVDKMVRKMLNNGIFFRASLNRRQNLYWFPGLNAGIPFVKKPKDYFHELCFFVHDCIHQCIPDLIYSGQDDPISRFVYISYRLMSEAVTLVGADMYFADSLKRSGYDYKTMDNRKIYPLFESLKVSFEDKENLFELMKANMKFCLLGDADGFTKQNADPEKLQDFVSKYEKFFVADFAWTRHNYEDMRSRKQTYQKWWSSVSHWYHEEKMITISDFTNMLGEDFPQLINDKKLEEACNVVFDKILELYVRPAFLDSNDLEEFSVRYDRTFRRYMMGQSYIFFRYGFLPHDHFFSPINQIMSETTRISPEQGECIRSFYNGYLEFLKERSLVTTDDIKTYQEVYPLFEPMILSYDDELTVEHRAFALRILDGN